MSYDCLSLSLSFSPYLSLSLFVGVESFLMYSIHEGIRGIALDPNDNMETLMPITGSLFAVGVDFHAGNTHLCVCIIYSIVYMCV